MSVQVGQVLVELFCRIFFFGGKDNAEVQFVATTCCTFCRNLADRKELNAFGFVLTKIAFSWDNT